MTYKEYIDLGFKRVDLNDQVEFNRTGYSGYYLELNIAKHVSIEVCSSELDKPKLYIPKHKSSTCLIIVLSIEQVKELVTIKTQ
jgi:hypothetical protein